MRRIGWYREILHEKLRHNFKTDWRNTPWKIVIVKRTILHENLSHTCIPLLPTISLHIPHMVLRNRIGVSQRLIFEKSEADRHTTLALTTLQVEFLYLPNFCGYGTTCTPEFHSLPLYPSFLELKYASSAILCHMINSMQYLPIYRLIEEVVARPQKENQNKIISNNNSIKQPIFYTHDSCCCRCSYKYTSSCFDAYTTTL